MSSALSLSSTTIEQIGEIIYILFSNQAQWCCGEGSGNRTGLDSAELLVLLTAAYPSMSWTLDDVTRSLRTGERLGVFKKGQVTIDDETSTCAILSSAVQLSTLTSDVWFVNCQLAKVNNSNRVFESYIPGTVPKTKLRPSFMAVL